MRSSIRVVVVVVFLGVSGGWVSAQEGGPIGPSPYDVVEGWLKPFAGEGFALGGNSGVFAESPDRIFVLQRGETRLPDPVPPAFSGFVGSIGRPIAGAPDQSVDYGDRGTGRADGLEYAVPG